jgi:hypothetical protein
VSRAETIREYLRQNGATTPESGITRTQIRAALGLTKNQSSSGINDLKSAGFLASVGEIRGMRYYVTGKVPMAPLTPDAKRESEKARQIRRRRMAGSVSRAEYLAGLAAKRDAEAAERAQRKAARAANKAANQRREALKAAAAKVIKAKKVAKTVAKVRAVAESNYRFTSIKVAQVAAPLPSSDDFIRAGGVVQVIGNEIGKPFRAMPFNNRAEAA